MDGVVIMETLFSATLWAAAIGCGLIAGVYFTFSAFVMRSLTAIPVASAVSAMDSINRVIVSSAFLPLFFGTTLASALLVGSVLLPSPATSYAAIGGVIYLVGMFICTVAFNVPLNNKLAALDPDSEEADLFWPVYAQTWTRWNHVRTVASTATAVLYTYAISLT